MERDNRNFRALIVGKRAASVHLLRMALNMAGITNIVFAAESTRALDLLRSECFDVVYCDELADTIKGVAFPRAARKADGVINAMMPIFLVYSRAAKTQVERARDDGVTGVITMPMSAATIVRKLDAAIARPKPFIVASDFFGPDRRFASRNLFGGPDRRKRAPRKVKINQGAKADSSNEDDRTLI